MRANLRSAPKKKSAPNKVNKLRATQAAASSGKKKAASRAKTERSELIKSRVGKAVAGLSKGGGLNAPPEAAGTDHAEAVAIGREIQQTAQRSQPGKAQALIKNRRV